jgi:hypothetical protein
MLIDAKGVSTRCKQSNYLLLSMPQETILLQGRGFAPGRVTVLAAPRNRVEVRNGPLDFADQPAALAPVNSASMMRRGKAKVSVLGFAFNAPHSISPSFSSPHCPDVTPSCIEGSAEPGPHQGQLQAVG